MGTYHVVCHECPEERMIDDREAARTLQSSHEAETGHRVSCKEIAPEAVDA